MGVCTRGFLTLAALAGLSSFSQAYILIDDFTVGEYHGVINWPNNHDGHDESGLDPSHSAFGYRATNLTVQTNFDHVSLNLDIGGGVERVSYSSHNTATRLDSLFGGNGFNVLDFSNESEFWVDVFTENPSNRLADGWNIQAIDTSDETGSSGTFLLRNGGIYFKRSGFSGHLDWKHIKFMQFQQKFSPDDGTVPLAYGATKIYAVPEIATTPLLWAAIVSFLRRPRRASRKNDG